MYPLGAIANERTAAALKAKGYVAGENAGHCDGNVQNATLADALVWIGAATRPTDARLPRLSPTPRPSIRRPRLADVRQDFAEDVEVDRLREVEVEARRHGPGPILRLTVAGERHEQNSRPAGRADAPRHLVPVEPGRPMSTSATSGRPAMARSTPCSPSIAMSTWCPCDFEQLLQRFAVVGAVLDDEDVARRRRRPRGSLRTETGPSRPARPEGET